MSNSSTGTSKMVTYRTALIAAGIVGLGVLLLYVSGRNDWFPHEAGLRSLLNGLAALLITTGGLTVLWDLRGKKDVVELVLERLQVATDVRAAGVQRLSMDWANGVPWTSLFEKSREVDIFISYGSSFRKLYWADLQKFTAKRGNKLYLYLPDPRDEPSMRVLALRYSYGVEKVRDHILETAHAIATLSQKDGADVRIYYRKGDPAFTSYRFDSTFVITLYSNKRARGPVPTMMFGEGTYHEFFSNDLAAIRRQSEEISLSQLAEGGSGG